MSFYSGDIFGDFGDKGKKRSGHRIAFVICVVFLVLTVGIMIYLKHSEDSKESALTEFEVMLDTGDYDGALALYREMHDQVVSAPDVNAENVALSSRTMAQMELAVHGRVSSIEDKLRNERYQLMQSDIDFLNEMGELTASQLSDWLRSLCEEFLLGQIEKPDIIFIFDQLEVVTDVNASANMLRREIETIEMARGDVMTAEHYYRYEDYVESVKIYTNVMESYSGFVYDYAYNRVGEIKNVMYSPMLELGEHMLDTLKYYSAEDLFSDLAVIFPDDNRIMSDLIEATAHTSETHEYYGTVEVLCIRSLIADTSVLYGENLLSSNLDLHLTGTEFQNILQTLYENDYILVDAETMADQTGDTFLVEQPLIVPVGKKPVILVIENLDHTARDYGVGTCSRLVLNEQGQVCGEYTDSTGSVVVSRNAEAIGILDSFVEDHPDFSYNGAKGVISVCGYESVFGYVVSTDEIDDRNAALTSIGYPNADFTDEEIASNCETVSEIAAVLYDTGWKFASSTYGNINAYDSDMETIQADTQKWIDQVGALLPDVHIIVYPGGNYIYGTDPRAEYLKALHFRIFFGIGSNPYYIFGSNYLYYDRAIINPSTLRNTDYTRFLGNASILEDIRTS
ncbi:MAG: hypothetical protein J5685_11690 [Clostridiales bacterium]|nr:hypothetical protein [Clostridiales bacterium]